MRALSDTGHTRYPLLTCQPAATPRLTQTTGVRVTLPPSPALAQKKGMEQNGALIAVIGDEETVTGMLLAGVGNVDARRTSNFMVVDSSELPFAPLLLR